MSRVLAKFSNPLPSFRTVLQASAPPGWPAFLCARVRTGLAQPPQQGDGRDPLHEAVGVEGREGDAVTKKPTALTRDLRRASLPRPPVNSPSADAAGFAGWHHACRVGTIPPREREGGDRCTSRPTRSSLRSASRRARGCTTPSEVIQRGKRSSFSTLTPIRGSPTGGCSPFSPPPTTPLHPTSAGTVTPTSPSAAT